MAENLNAADGRWPEILMGLGGVSAEQLTDRHQPCPACGGADRYRWDGDSGPGGWYCNQCGGKDRQGGGGNGMDLLMRVRGWDFKQASSQVKQFLGIESVSDSVKHSRPFRQAETPPADAAAPKLGRSAVAQWCYRNADGHQLFWVQRVNRSGGAKYFLLVIWLDGGWHTVTKRDAFRADWPEPRPLYRLPDLGARLNAPVVIAEGEKAVDAAAELLGENYVAVGFRNGAKSANKSDWAPLRGRRVVLLPDNDDDGAEFAQRVSRELRQVGVDSIAVCRPPEDAPEKWDIADGRDHDGWGPLDAELWIAGAVAQAGVVAPTPPPTEPPADSGPTRWDEFGLLGVDRGTFFYHPREGGQILALSAAAHTATNLLQLAGERWWQDRWPRYNADGEVIGIRWQSVNSDLFRAQYQIGIFDPWRSRGPGVWLDEDRPVIHLGDRIIVDGEVRDVRDGPEGSNYIYDKDYAIEGPGDAKPLSEKDGMGLLVVACSFNWEQESAGMLLVGWLFLAPICGALDWRPHIWLTAAAGSGKTTVLFRFLVKLLGNFALKPVGASTEAGIRQKLASAARPVIFDEAESNEDDDKRRIQRILDLARVSSSRDQGEVLKGTIGGDGMNFAVRSMFLLCSISTALKQNADKTRFTVLTLLRATERLNAAEAADQWKKIDAELKHVATPETGRAMIARACAMVHVIREAAAVFSDACAVQLGNQRLGDQYGTLCAGAWALCNANVPTPEDAAMWLSMYPLTAFAEESKAVTDEGSLRGTLLEHKIKVDLPDRGAQTRTVRELVERIGAGASLGPDDDVVTVKAAIAALGRYGFKVVDSVMVEGGVEMAGALLVSNTAKAIKREILKGTAWQECHPQTLTRAYGAKRVDAAQWFAGLGTHRAVALPLDALDA
jgi:putative DNA primase/helicase